MSGRGFAPHSTIIAPILSQLIHVSPVKVKRERDGTNQEGKQAAQPPTRVRNEIAVTLVARSFNRGGPIT